MRPLLVALLLIATMGCKAKPTPTVDPATEDARKKNCPDLPTWEACDARLTAQAAKKAADEEAIAAASRAKSASETVTKSSHLTRADRDEWVRECVQKHHCKQWQIDSIIAGAPAPDRDHTARVSFAAAAEDIARQAKDGDLNVAQAGVLAGLISRPDMGFAMLSEMRKTTLADAKKDPDSNRGRTLVVSGSIIEIHKKDGLVDGALMSSGSVIRFVTALPTDGIYEDTWSTFRGVFVQEYAYGNVSGGQTRSTLLVGGFDTEANRKPPKPIALSLPPGASMASATVPR